MSKLEQEREIAYEWISNPIKIEHLAILSEWQKIIKDYHLIDSIYDTYDGLLAKEKVGVRIRTKDKNTTLTAKKYMGESESGVIMFDEYSTSLKNSIHPIKINTSKLKIALPKVEIFKLLEFRNQRHEVIFTNGPSCVTIINEYVTYSNNDRVHSEHLVEVEFNDVQTKTVSEIKKEIESSYPIRQIREGKSDRAHRFLNTVDQKVIIENFDSIQPIKMSAHGGNGLLEMRFFHQAYNHYYSPEVSEKVLNFEQCNWDFFGVARLPVGADIKEHLHEETDELYYILRGYATIKVDGQERKIRPGDCILTRKGSSHSVYDVTKPLEFIAIEIR